MDFNKKEMPLQGFTGFGGGATGAAFRSSASAATYVDDVFSTFVYTGSRNTNGSGSSDVINNGIDLSGKGGMIWLKGRDSQPYDYGNGIFDTVRGKTKNIQTQSSAGEATYPNAVSSFNSNGFTLNDGTYNWLDSTYASWTFRKKSSWFTIKQYSGTGSNQSISHDLGSVPGMILIKRTSSAEDWLVYHRSTGNNKGIGLNESNAGYTGNIYWNDTTPTATTFSVGTQDRVNTDGQTYIAYIFAGGASTAATANSVDFDGTTDELEVSDSADFDYGSGDFTLELWINPNINDHSSKLIHAHTSGSNYGPCNLYFDNSGTNMLTLYSSSNNSSFDVSSGTEFGLIPAGSWTHIAVAREGSSIRMFRNGLHVATLDHSGSMMNPTGTFDIGGRLGTNFFNGKVSNFRVVKGTAVYTTSFKVPTEPLTNITNTVLLCCNNSSSTTGSTVVPSGSSITANGDPTVSTDSPFDDPDGFAFGEDEDENIIKMGKYIGNGATTGPEIYLGWQPQWILMKEVADDGNWAIFDTMRGIPTAGSDYYLKPNSTAVAGTNGQTIELTGNSFKLRYGQTISNVDDETYIYVAIRSADGTVGKLPEAGTEAFAMDTGNSSTPIPVFDSGFPVDLSLLTQPASTLGNYLATRLSAGQELLTNTNAGSASASNNTFDSNVGWRKGGTNSTFQSWMWKRNAGMDVVVFRGTANNTGYGGQRYAHSLGQTPELKIMKRMDTSSMGWITTGTVISQGLASNNNSKDYYIYLNSGTAAVNFSNYWDGNDTSIDFSVRSGNGEAGGSGGIFQVILLASIEGISKVGSYVGNGSATERTITTGFQPRFLFVKNASGTNNWVVFDTLRGWGSGNDYHFSLNSDAPQTESQDLGAPAATGFTLTTSLGNYNSNGDTYIYYAHA